MKKIKIGVIKMMMNNLTSMSFEQVMIFGMIIIVNLFMLVDKLETIRHN